MTSDEKFTRLSDQALRMTNALMIDLELAERGLDEVPVFNAVMKALVNSEIESEPTPCKD